MAEEEAKKGDFKLYVFDKELENKCCVQKLGRLK